MSQSDDRKNIGCSIIVIVLILLAVIFSFTGLDKGYSTGERAGIINKFSEKGIIWKPGEGQLSMVSSLSVPGMLSFAAAGTWDFSVTDPAVAADINKAVESGKRVRLIYVQYLLAPISQSTKYTVVKVDALE